MSEFLTSKTIGAGGIDFSLQFESMGSTGSYTLIRDRGSRRIVTQIDGYELVVSSTEELLDLLRRQFAELNEFVGAHPEELAEMFSHLQFGGRVVCRSPLFEAGFDSIDEFLPQWEAPKLKWHDLNMDTPAMSYTPREQVIETK